MDRVQNRVVTCPAGTPATAPLEFDLSFPPGQVDRIRIRIPVGHSFQTGIALCQAHTPVIPADPDPFLIGDDDKFEVDVIDLLKNGSWTAKTYNAGSFPHSWQITFWVGELRRPARGLRSLLPIAELRAR